MIRLLLVRHGQSEWNAAGRWQGQADPPLTELGESQAKAAAEALPPFDHLAASTLRRARRTAEIIGDAVGIDGIQLEADLIERDAGEFSGLTKEEIEQRFPGYLGNDIWPDGWEDDERLEPRVRRGLHAVADATPPGGTAVVITHGGCIYSLERSLGAPFERIANVGGRWFGVNDGHITLGERVHLLDESSETTPDQL